MHPLNTHLSRPAMHRAMDADKPSRCHGIEFDRSPNLKIRRRRIRAPLRRRGEFSIRWDADEPEDWRFHVWDRHVVPTLSGLLTMTGKLAGADSCRGLSRPKYCICRDAAGRHHVFPTSSGLAQDYELGCWRLRKGKAILHTWRGDPRQRDDESHRVMLRRSATPLLDLRGQHLR